MDQALVCTEVSGNTSPTSVQGKRKRVECPPAPRKIGTRHRNWVFTHNCDVEEWAKGAEHIMEAVHERNELFSWLKYIIVGQEVASTGQHHLQGYLECKNPQAMQAVKEGLGWPSCHLEPRMGKQEDAINYCKKEGKWWEAGVKANQGSRSDLEAIKKALDEGANMYDVAQINFGDFIRYYRGFASYRGLVRAMPRGVPLVLWFWGESGSGKTMAVSALCEKVDAYWLTPSSTGLWWDGYDGESVVVLDELRGSWLPHSTLLRLLDGSPYRAQQKGAMVALRAHTFYITTNKPPHMTYEDDPYGALIRRVHDFCWVYECTKEVFHIRNKPSLK